MISLPSSAATMMEPALRSTFPSTTAFRHFHSSSLLVKPRVSTMFA